MQAATRQEQKAATRDRLVNAAMALFARKGIVQTTTADIAKSIRMSHGVVFLHFPKRDDLVIAVIDEFERPLLFNTWIGLVHHYLVNRDLFATGDSVISEHGDALVQHLITLVKA